MPQASAQARARFLVVPTCATGTPATRSAPPPAMSARPEISASIAPVVPSTTGKNAALGLSANRPSVPRVCAATARALAPAWPATCPGHSACAIQSPTAPGIRRASVWRPCRRPAEPREPARAANVTISPKGCNANPRCAPRYPRRPRFRLATAWGDPVQPPPTTLTAATTSATRRPASRPAFQMRIASHPTLAPATPAD